MHDATQAGGERRDHWIVQGPDVSSGTLLDHLRDDPHAEVVRRIAKDMVVVAMTRSRAEQLRSDFVQALVEIDSDIQPSR